MDNNTTEMNAAIVTANPTQNDYKEVFKNYDVTEDEAKVMINLVDKYRNKESYDYYTSLPKPFKSVADGLYRLSIQEQSPITKLEAARVLLSEISNDAEFNNAINSFQDELNSAFIEMNTGYNQIIKDAFQKTFDNITEYETLDPDKAELIKAVKKAFENSTNYDKQLEYINNNSINKLRKFAGRFTSECIYFNKLVNTTDVKIPDISELLLVIHKELPEYDIETIKIFIISIIKCNYNIDVSNNIVNLAYIYKLITNIYNYKFITDRTNDESGALLFGNIAKVLDCIKNK